MKRYLAFYWGDHDAMGGMNDLWGDFDTFDDAAACLEPISDDPYLSYVIYDQQERREYEYCQGEWIQQTNNG
jgi:hypothetical protein